MGQEAPGEPGGAGPLLVEQRGEVCVVTLNRPAALNAVDPALHGALARVWPELDADPDIRAIVLTGAGRAFSGGGDLHLLDRMANDLDVRSEMMTEASDIVRGMTAVRAPIVAAVNGPAVGLGCSLAALSDLVVVDEEAYFADPHVALGLVAADGGALTWPLLMGLLQAKEHILLGDRVPADEALRIGLANRVAPAGTSVDVALELAGRLAALPPQAVQASKRVLNASLHHAVEALLQPALDDESASFDEPAFQANLARMLRRDRAS